MTTSLMAIMTATGMFIIMAKLGLFKLFKIKEARRLADGGLDALATFGLIAIFAGTFHGIIVGMLSGLMLSGMLLITRKIIKPTKTLGGKLDGVSNWFKGIPSVLRKSAKHSVT